MRGFRASRFLGLFPPTLRGAAGPTPAPPYQDSHDPQSDEQLISVPASSSVRYPLIVLTVVDVTKYQDPLHVLLKYIAEVSTSYLICYACAYLLLIMTMQKEPDCDMVLVHDVDLECIDALHIAVCLFIYQSNVPSMSRSSVAA